MNSNSSFSNKVEESCSLTYKDWDFGDNLEVQRIMDLCSSNQSCSTGCLQRQMLCPSPANHCCLSGWKTNIHSSSWNEVEKGEGNNFECLPKTLLYLSLTAHQQQVKRFITFQFKHYHCVQLWMYCLGVLFCSSMHRCVIIIFYQVNSTSVQVTLIPDLCSVDHPYQVKNIPEQDAYRYKLVEKFDWYHICMNTQKNLIIFK